MHASLCAAKSRNRDLAGICQNLSEYLYKNHRFLSTVTQIIGTNRQVILYAVQWAVTSGLACSATEIKHISHTEICVLYTKLQS